MTHHDPTAAISVRGLSMSYGEHEVLAGVDLDVRRGEIFAFLGPNGAGKTTTVEILEGFRHRTGGDVRVLGEDPATAGTGWRERVGVVLQESRLEPALTARECLTLYAGYYAAPRPVDETLALVGLRDNADERAGRLSGGQQRRLDVALALIGDPELVFLDEPTTGFDPAARRIAWDAIHGLRALGKTVFLTTHFMEEAEALADRIAVLAGGRIVAQGTADTLGGRDHRASRVSFALPRMPYDDPELDEIAGAAVSGDGRIALETTAPMEVVAALAAWADEHSADVRDLEVRRPTLEDVYLELTEMS